MKQQTHIVDLLNAAKLLADTNDNGLLSYIINMAIIEALNTKEEKTKADGARKAA